MSPGDPVAVKVLVVDDQRVIRANLRIRFERLGCVVAEAENALEALKAFSDFAPHFITLDIVMPSVEGFTALDLLRHVRRHTDQTEVVILSSVMSANEREQFMSEGAIAFLCKPFDSFDGLVRKVQPLIAALQSSSSTDTAEMPARFLPPRFSSGSNPPSIDEGILSELRELTQSPEGTSQFSELIDTFLEEMAEHVNLILASAGDAKRVALSAHNIKGAANSMGARRLGIMAAELEAEAIGGAIQNDELKFNNLDNELTLVRRVLEHAKGRGPGISRHSVGE